MCPHTHILQLVERIDADMDLVTDNVAAGHTELQKFYASVTGNRAFVLKLFAVLVVVILLVAFVRRL